MNKYQGLVNNSFFRVNLGVPFDGYTNEEHSFLSGVSNGSLVVLPREAIEAALKSLGYDLLSSGTQRAWNMVQNPGRLAADANNNPDHPWGKYVRSILGLMDAANMTERDFLSLLLADQPFNSMPPVGSREEDQELGIRWEYRNGSEVKAEVGGKYVFFPEGYDRDGRTVESALKMADLSGPDGWDEQVVRSIATLRGESVWVIWPNSSEPVAIEPQV